MVETLRSELLQELATVRSRQLDHLEHEQGRHTSLQRQILESQTQILRLSRQNGELLQRIRALERRVGTGPVVSNPDPEESGR